MLTEKTIRDAKPGPQGKDQYLWDRQVPGFGLRVTGGGAKAFIVTYRIDGRKRRAVIGKPAEMPLKAARERAAVWMAKVREGVDPARERQARRDAPTMADLLDRFFEEYTPERVRTGRMTARTVREYRLQASKHVLPALGRIKVADIGRQDIEAMLAGLPPVTMNRVHSFIRRLLNLAEQLELRPMGSNPARRIERAREEARDRTLAPSELAALARALREREETAPAAVAAIRFAALTGLRIGEILAIRWADVNFETRTLTMPETKTGRRTHDLSPPALALLADLPRFNGCDWTFTATGSSRLAYKSTRQHFAAIVADAGLADVRLHDLRRTFMTTAAAAGVPTHTLRDLLGHSTTAMADRYVRRAAAPVRDARDRMGERMAALLDGAPEAEIVPLKR